MSSELLQYPKQIKTSYRSLSLRNTNVKIFKKVLVNYSMNKCNLFQICMAGSIFDINQGKRKSLDDLINWCSKIIWQIISLFHVKFPRALEIGTSSKWGRKSIKNTVACIIFTAENLHTFLLESETRGRRSLSLFLSNTALEGTDSTKKKKKKKKKKKRKFKVQS